MELMRSGSVLSSLGFRCLIRIIQSLDDYPDELLALLPTRQRKEILMSLPPLDICRLELNPVVSEVDMDAVWLAISEFYKEAHIAQVITKKHFKYHRAISQRYADLAESAFYDQVRNSWRALFLTRTVHILLHSFDPSNLPITVEHRSWCNTRRSHASPCSCEACGFDANHCVLFQRLIDVPLYFENTETRWEIYLETLREFSRSARHRFPKFAEDKITALELLKVFVTDCQFKPKVLLINCEFVYLQ